MCVRARLLVVTINNYEFLSGAFSYIFLTFHFIPFTSVYALRPIWHGSVFIVAKLFNNVHIKR